MINWNLDCMIWMRHSYQPHLKPQRALAFKTWFKTLSPTVGMNLEKLFLFLNLLTSLKQCFFSFSFQHFFDQHTVKYIIQPGIFNLCLAFLHDLISEVCRGFLPRVLFLWISFLFLWITLMFMKKLHTVNFNYWIKIKHD